MSTNRWANPVNNNILRDLEGVILPSGSVAFYLAGTSTPMAVYSDKDQTASLGAVLNCDAYGLIPDFHVPAGTQFKVVAYDAQNGPAGSGAVQWTRDYQSSLDSSAEARLDAVEETVSALAGVSQNACINGGMRIGTGTVLTMTSSFANGKVKKLRGRATNVTAGTLTQAASTDYVSGYYASFAGVSLSAAGVVEGQILIPAGEASRFVDKDGTFSCLVQHDVGVAVDYTIAIKTPTTTADDFSTLTTIGTSAATSVASATDTRLEFSVTGLGDTSKGIAVEISAAIASAITTKNFGITEAQLEIGTARTPFSEQNYSVAARAASDDITQSGFEMATNRLLGRTAASTGAIQEITAGAGLGLSGADLRVTQALINACPRAIFKTNDTSEVADILNNVTINSITQDTGANTVTLRFTMSGVPALTSDNWAVSACATASSIYSVTRVDDDTIDIVFAYWDNTLDATFAADWKSHVQVWIEE